MACKAKGDKASKQERESKGRELKRKKGLSRSEMFLYYNNTQLAIGIGKRQCSYTNGEEL
jgi:hypothetical protein